MRKHDFKKWEDAVKVFIVQGIKQDELRNNMWLSHYQVKDMMTSELATLEPDDSIRTALAVFQENLFHALPIVKGDELLGLITTYDLLKYFAQETIQLSDYKTTA